MKQRVRSTAAQLDAATRNYVFSVETVAKLDFKWR